MISKAPFLKSISIPQLSNAELPYRYPFSVPWLWNTGLSLSFEVPITILVGENGVGKSTIIEAIAALAGYDQAGGGKGYRPTEHTNANEGSGAELVEHLKAAWLPKVTDGWFFRAETFFTVARYLNSVQSPNDFLSKSHGEGFLDLFIKRLGSRGLFILDEPESALSIKSQMAIVHLLASCVEHQDTQVIMATHSPILAALPGAQIFEVSNDKISSISSFKDTKNFKLMKRFYNDPEHFMAELR